MVSRATLFTYRQEEEAVERKPARALE